LAASKTGVILQEASGDEVCLDDLLQDATNRNSTEAASAILAALAEFRARNFTQEQQESFVNALLTNGPDAPLPFWARFRPLAKYSRRARMFCLRRTLNVIAPPVSSQSKTDENTLARRRRALISLLRSMSTEELEDDAGQPAIVALEKKARRASKESGKDLISRRPQDLETPEYEVIATGDELIGKNKGLSIEIRRYKPYSVCSVPMNKPRPDDSSKTDAKLRAPELKGASSFGALAGYLFGKNQQSTAMKMTTPVFTTGLPDNVDDSENDIREMQFVLPSEYWGDEKLRNAPVPLDGSGVTLQNRESEDRAVLMFSGYASAKSSKKRLNQLLSSLSSRDSKWKVVPNTESLAQYNDPFTPPWRRLNEVSVKVEPR
jgi:SOUL heme-binding protein